MGTTYYETPDREAVRQQLLSVVRNDVGHELFTANSLLDLVALLDQGAENMVREDQVDPDHMDDARVAVHDLLATLVAVRDESGESHFQETTVSQAWMRLCPGFWPVC